MSEKCQSSHINICKGCDCRSRRIYRGTSDGSGGTEHMVSVFEGGLAIQEYVVGGRDGSPQPSALRTEFIRGEGMGGGVGGMVYSIQNGDIICSHANHRGDVIARSSDTGSLTYFALYEAYGTRPYEWGSDPDRFKNNTKEEETDLGLTNDGMRYRDLETGVFLTRDPIGYGDGPNIYCYVHCNPITQFDPWGLKVGTTTTENEDGSMHTEFSIEATIVFDDPELTKKDKDGNYVNQDKRDAYVQNVRDGLMESYNGQDGSHTWSLNENNLNLSITDSAADVKSESDHIIMVTTSERAGDSYARGRAERGGGMAKIYTDKMADNVLAHEVLHFFGIRDNVGLRDPSSPRNLSDSPTYKGSTELTSTMVKQMQKNVDTPGAVNNNLGPRSDTKFRNGNPRALKEAAIHYRPRIINGEATHERNYNY